MIEIDFFLIHCILKISFPYHCLLTARQTKLQLHKIYFASPTPENTANYKQFRNEYNTAVGTQKAQYYEDSLASSKNAKSAWNILKEAANLSKSTHTISEISIDGTLSSDTKAIANTFNSFFSTVGSKIANSLPPSNTGPLSYCAELPDTARLLELEGCGQILVGNTIKTLVSKSSTDLDGISSKLLKAIQNEIERPLAHIFSGVFPDHLKASRVVPIQKSGDTTNCDNYRPISLVNAFSKVLEKIVCTKLVNHLESNSLLYKHQYGFLTRIPTPYRVYLIDTGYEGRARDSRPPQPHQLVDLFLTGGRDESR